MIKRSALPKGIITKILGDTKLVRTLAGHFKTQEVVTMQDIRLPEFNKNRLINQQKVLVFDNDNVKYDIILGRYFLSKTGIKLNYSEGNICKYFCHKPKYACTWASGKSTYNKSEEQRSENLCSKPKGNTL
jgi:hypothetical protein